MEPHDALPDGSTDNAIAVVGMACRFPGDATNIEKFWEMIRDGKDAWSEIPADRFNARGWYHPDPNRPGSFHIRGAHFIKNDIAAFDAPFFSISTTEAVSMDPQQRMLLEVVYEALDSAGIPVSSLSNTATSVFCGSFVRDYEQPCMRDPDSTPPYSATGNGIAILANRISHAFDFAGTSQTIDTGCSASMIAVHQACQSLLTEESCLGIAAGVGLIFSPNTLVPMADLNILGPDGRCFTFDERANGYGRGEGAGVVVLKRLRDAIADNDTIRAVIRATASNQDGHTQGITLPSKERQVQNMSDVYYYADLDITRTAYMECHGTGTQVGDVKETQAVTELFCKHRTSTNPLIIGSVKTNIGHLEGSAGVAGVIKGVLVVERGFIPKHLNFVAPNPKIDFEKMKLKVANELSPWPTPGLRRASVNSFGFGGTNAHVVLDDAPHFLTEHRIFGGHHSTYLHPNDPAQKYEHESVQTSHPQLFVFSGHDEAGLVRVLASQAGYLDMLSPTQAIEVDYAYTLFCRRSHMTWRTYVIASSAVELAQMLKDKDITKRVQAAHGGAIQLSFVFCGQGAQWHAMGHELLRYRVFRDSIYNASLYMREMLGCPFDLWEELHRSKELSRVNGTQISQPATTAIQVALVDLLVSAGLFPDSVVGHSSGEIAAAYAAGAIRRLDAWKIAYHRGQCASQVSALTPGICGGMLAVALSEEDARRAIAQANVDVDVACINGPESVTLSGDAKDISNLSIFIRAQGYRAARVNVDIAYHSRQMQVIENAYRTSLSGLAPPLSGSKTRFFSSLLGREATASELTGDYWVQNLIKPVQFYLAASAMMETGPAMLLEVSPHCVWESTLHQIHSVLTSTNARCSMARPAYACLLHRDEDASVTVLKAMGDMWLRGVLFNPMWELSIPRQRPRHLVDVPSYPWDHSKKYWHESDLSKANRFRSHGREDIIGAPLENSTPQEPRWRGFFRVQENPWLEDHVIQKSIIYPAGGMVAMAVEAAKQLADHRRKVLGYEILDFKICNPMLIPTSQQGLENMLAAHLLDQQGKSTRESESSYEFSILSKPTDGSWTVHSRGRFVILYCESCEPDVQRKLGATSQIQAYKRAQSACHTQIQPRQFYESLEIIGMTYGPLFRNLVEIERGDTSAHVVVEIPNTKACMPLQFEFDHVIHPATLDGMIQTALVLNDGSDAMLPCSATRIFVSAELPRGAGARLQGYATRCESGRQSTTMDITMFDDNLQAQAVAIEGLVFRSAVDQNESSRSGFLPANRNLCSELVWKPDVSKISALGLNFPTSILDIVDLAAHKNPAMSICYHIADGSIPDLGNAWSTAYDAQQLDIFGETMKLASFVVDTVSLGYETPRFSQCLITGAHSDQVLQHIRLIKDAAPTLERVQQCAILPSNATFDLAFCSTHELTPNESLIDLCKSINVDGWLVVFPKLGEAIGTTQNKAFRTAIQSAGFQLDGIATKSCPYIAAQKTAPNPLLGILERPRTEDLVILIPDVMSPLVLALRNILHVVIPQRMPCCVRELRLSSMAEFLIDSGDFLVLSLIEIDLSVIFSMGAQLYDAIHRLFARACGILWITQGAQNDCYNPDRSPFVGLARTIHSENTKKQVVSLDLDHTLGSFDGGTGARPIPEGLVNGIISLLAGISTRSSPVGSIKDVEYVFSQGQLMIPRLMPLTALNYIIEKGSTHPQFISQQPLLAGNVAMRFDCSSLGATGGPWFVKDTEAISRPLLPDEVRIAVAGTNLLPEDILIATAATPTDFVSTDVFGYVIEVGSAVASLSANCLVVARTRDTLKTHVIVGEARTRRISHLYDCLGNCPTAFATAVYALHTKRRVAKGDSVLIYGALTAYGQAAIRIAMLLGAQVLVACTAPEEKTAMRVQFKIPPCHILDMTSTSCRFEEDVLSLTQQRGADVVFDPTSRYIEQAFRCVVECGRVIRVVQKGLAAPSCFLTDKSLSFETVNLDLLETQRPAEAQMLASDIKRLLQLAPGLDSLFGVFEYNMSELQTALQHAAANLYRGPHLMFTEADTGSNMVNSPIQLTHPVQLSSTSTYLLIGGLGGLGRSIAERLVKLGARHIAFFSRSGAAAASAKALLDKLNASGVRTQAFLVDICNESHLVAAIRDVRASMPPIRGAIQCAAVVDDIAFSSMSYTRWRRVFEPKTRGSYNLHLHLPCDMDFFVFLSSSSGVIGNRGQANYAAGNSFQDALARHRSKLGMHSVSVDLGLVLGAGMVAENKSLLDAMKASGFFGIRIQDAIFVLERAMSRPGMEPRLHIPAQIVTAVGTGGLTLQNQPADPFWTRSAMFRYLNQVDAPPCGLNAPGSAAGGRDLRCAIQMAGTVEEASQTACRAVIAKMARRKGMVPDDFDQNQPLSSYGIDSLDSIFILGWIARETGVALQTVEGLTIAELGRDVARRTLDAITQEQG